MDLSSAQTLIEILLNVDIFIVIFIRMIGFVSIAPVIGGKSIPIMARIGFSLVLAGIVHTSGLVSEIYYVDSVLGYALLMLKEFFVGYILGYVVYFIFNLTYFAGQIVDQQIGLSMANVYDPLSQMQVPIVGNIYYNIICMFLVITGGHRILIEILFYSYEALPIGQAVFLQNSGFLMIMIDLMTRFFTLGFVIAMPIVAMILILDVALGILVKAAPKINVFVVGMPLKVLVGLIGIFLVLPMFIPFYETFFELIVESLISVIKVLMP